MENLSRTISDPSRDPHRGDPDDAEALLGFVGDREALRWIGDEPGGLDDFFTESEPELFRFPAIDPSSFRRRVDAAGEE